MSERVLTDNELKGIALGAWHSSPAGYPRNFVDVARAVEAAVLEKALEKWGRAQVTEERVQLNRERAAFAAGARRHGAGAAWIEREIEGYYPLPASWRARTVVLSDGASVGANSSGSVWCRWVGNSIHTELNSTPFVWAVTPADARLLADLVERPTELVPG